jgi:membrane associated rhomboid family serine protease
LTGSGGREEHARTGDQHLLAPPAVACIGCLSHGGGEVVIPYKADTDDPAQAMPRVNIGLIVANILVFFLRRRAGRAGIGAESVPPRPLAGAVRAHAQLRRLPGDVEPGLGHALHVGVPACRLGHILGNMLFLFVFGNHVENGDGPRMVPGLLPALRSGRQRTRDSHRNRVECAGLGAGGAISGVLAAYLVLYPTSRV